MSSHRWIVEEVENGERSFVVYNHDREDTPESEFEFYDRYETIEEAVKACRHHYWDFYEWNNLKPLQPADAEGSRA
jgi:calcineurin-like phosphoesterase family protein